MLGFLASSILGMALRGGVKAVAGRALANGKADVAVVPPKVKLALLGLLVLVALFFVHQHIAHKALAKARADERVKVNAEWHRELAKARARAVASAATRRSEPPPPSQPK
jgi:hypothetical protein